jgi:tRNA pseudouridine synthase 10
MTGLVTTLVSKAAGSARGFEWSTFSVSSSLPKEVLAREEDVADLFAPGRFTSIKNWLNARLAEEIAHSTGKPNTQRYPDAIFEFDFDRADARARAAPVYLFGRYIKLSRKHCQSRWHCSECRGKGCPLCGGSGRNYPSVEDELASAVVPAFGAEECTLHACGREDVDVRCLGAGRPFVLEIKKPAKREVDTTLLEKKLQGNPSVRAAGLRIVKPHFLDAVCNSHFDKEYDALVSADRPLGLGDIAIAESLSGKVIFQQTPRRVLARRTDMERRRSVSGISARAERGGRLRLRIFAEAGTYIKELINSDAGRTRPSVSEILGCRCACEELDVVAIHDYFLETVRQD